MDKLKIEDTVLYNELFSKYLMGKLLKSQKNLRFFCFLNKEKWKK